MKKCPKCGFETNNNYRCISCGNDLSKIEPNIYENYDYYNKQCPKCGKSITMNTNQCPNCNLFLHEYKYWFHIFNVVATFISMFVSYFFIYMFLRGFFGVDFINSFFITIKGLIVLIFSGVILFLIFYNLFNRYPKLCELVLNSV